MFASSGYFRGLPCPFFANGLCERHYCHFRHVKSAEDVQPAVSDAPARQAAAEVNTSTRQAPSLIGMIGHAVNQVQRDGAHSRAQSLHAGRTGNYKPTPIAGGQLDNPPAAKTTSVQYKPTPLNVLRKMHESIKQRQHVDNSCELEYDPLTNFSTRQTLSSGAELAARRAAKRKSDKTYAVKVTCTKQTPATDEIVAKFSDDEDDSAVVAADSTKIDVPSKDTPIDNVVASKESVESKEHAPSVLVDEKENYVNSADVTFKKPDLVADQVTVKDDDKKITENETAGSAIAKKPTRSIFELMKSTKSDFFQRIKKATHATGAGCNGMKRELVESEPRQKISTSEQICDSDKLVTDESVAKETITVPDVVVPDKAELGKSVLGTASANEEPVKADLVCVQNEPTTDVPMSKDNSQSSDPQPVSSHKTSSSEHKKSSSSSSHNCSKKHHSSRHHHSRSAGSASRKHSSFSSHKTSSATSRKVLSSDSSDVKDSAEKVSGHSTQLHKSSHPTSNGPAVISSDSGNVKESSEKVDEHATVAEPATQSHATTSNGAKVISSDKSNDKESVEKVAEHAKKHHKSSHSDTKSHSSSSSSSSRKKEHSSSSNSTHKPGSHGTKKHTSSTHHAKKDHTSLKCSGHSTSHSSSNSSSTTTAKHAKDKASSVGDSSEKSTSVHKNGTSDRRHRHGSGKREHSSHRDASKHHSSSSKRHKSSTGPEKKAAESTQLKSTPSVLPNGGVDKVNHCDLFGVDSDLSDHDVEVIHVKEEKTKVPDDAIEISDESDCDTVRLIPDDYSLPSLSSDDETYTDCLKMCKKPKLSPQKIKKEKKDDEAEEVTEAVTTGKKRRAHARSADTAVCSGPSAARPAPRPAPRPTPAQVMQNRLKQMADRQNRPHTASAPSFLGSSFYKKSRTESMVKSAATNATDDPSTAGPPQRSAHVPKQLAPRPLIAAEFGSKVATNVRQRYLDLMIGETLKFSATHEDAYDRAVTEEKAVYQRCTSRNIYLNLCVNAIKKLRNEVPKSPTAASKDSSSTTEGGCSHAVMLGGAKAAQTSFTFKRRGGTAATSDTYETPTGATLYNHLCRYLATEENLINSGYPRPSTDDLTTAVLHICPNNKKVDSTNSERKTCCRCGKPFTVSAKGHYLKKEECVYHWGKSWKRRVAGSIEHRYTCCQGDLNSTGCAVGNFHVQEANKYSDLTNYAHTLPTSAPPDSDYGVYALDCEMIYTINGFELARVTVIGSDQQLVYDQLVKPGSKIVDYNTRFSGITSDDMKGIRTTLRDVQVTLTGMFSDRTILIGHSLESDLIALKLIHSTVVDTSFVFPHRLGLPYKRALKNLMSEILQKIIQNDEGGHDSKEDAVACMQLMHWKLKEDAKKQGRHS